MNLLLQIGASLIGAALLGASGLAAAQDYPSRPIRVIVPYTPGQGADSAARIVGTRLSERLRQPLIMDNRPGGAGNVGAEVVAKAVPDGYTLLVGSNATHAANAALYAALRFDPIKDFAPISFIGSVSMVMLSAPGFPAANIGDLIRMAKAAPGSINVAIPSSTARVVLEMLSVTSDSRFKDIPYKGSSAAVSDLLGGHVQLSIDTAMAATTLVSNGKLKALGVSTLKPTAVLPGVGTFAEAGLAGFDLSAWNVWLAPAGTPPEIVARLNSEIRAVLAEPEIASKMRSLGYEPSGTDAPAEVAALIARETRKWGDLIRSAGIKAD